MAGQTRGSLTVPVRRAGPMASEEGRMWRGEAGAAAAELNGQNLSEAHAWLPEEYARLHAPSLLKPGLQTPAALAPPPRPPPPPNNGPSTPPALHSHFAVFCRPNRKRMPRAPPPH